MSDDCLSFINCEHYHLVLLEHAGLNRVLPLAVHLFLLCLAGRGGHTESLLLLGFYYLETYFMLKSWLVGWGGGLEIRF